MAKKGGVQQLQAELSTDEEFLKFIENPGLLVLDVYSAWCGPCLGMVGSLRKIKLELGGDNLYLAICKADTVSYVHRFYKKSEPTWFFISHKKAVNIMFGTNVPKLMKLIAHELQCLTTKCARPIYAITDLQPEEVKRKKIVEDALARSKLIEDTAKEKKRREYLNHVTNVIMENLPDIGVTVFGPQVNRDMFKKLMEPADGLKMQCKDRRVVPVTKANWETVNFSCNNPLKPEVIEQLENKELLMCFWKFPDDSNKKISDILRVYATELMKSHTEVAKDGSNEVHTVPPLLAPLTVKVEIDLKDGEICQYEQEIIEIKEEFRDSAPAGVDPSANYALDTKDMEEGEDEDAKLDNLNIDLDVDANNPTEDNLNQIVEPETVKVPTKQICVKSVVIPPIWVPNNQRTHAALIYEFFRSQTAPFLPPDPIPEPPHIIMAFDAYKKRDLINLATRHKDDVPLYGFFTSDDSDNAKLIANNEKKYAVMPQSPSDKIIFKVCKATSYTMLSLATYGPSYVSPNINIGKEEATKLFPENYRSSEPESEVQDKQKSDSKKNRKSKKSGVHEVLSDNTETPAASPPPPEEPPAPVESAQLSTEEG